MSNDQAMTLLNHIGNELKLLWWQMEAWQELFDVEQEKRRVLIEATAPGFFAVVQATLAENIVMRIARLMDPAQTWGHANSSLKALSPALVGEAPSHLRGEIELLVTEWQKKDKETGTEQGYYAGLKFLRNKWLAHNDHAHRLNEPSDSLWMPLGHDDFVVVQQLAGRLWAIYRTAHRLLRGADVVEPKHAGLEGRSSQVLKRLSASLYLERMLDADEDEARWAGMSGLHAFERDRMGEDRQRHVFANGWESGR